MTAKVTRLGKQLEAYQDIDSLDIPERKGPRPKTTSTVPHAQLSQNAPVEFQNRLRDYALGLPGVRPGISQFAGYGTVAFFLDNPPLPPLLPNVFWEFGHIHPSHDGSLHMTLPTAVAKRLIELGWGEYHYAVKQGLIPPILLMLFGPRKEEELDVACRVIDAAYLAAGGDLRGTGQGRR